MNLLSKTLLTTAVSTSLISACAPAENTHATKSSTNYGNDFALKQMWQTEGFKMPESVFASSTHPWLYVSNVNGNNAGFISRVGKDGVIDNLQWVTGLDSPTGSDIYQNTLYVADGKKLHAINLDTGKVTQSFTADDAIGLNDVSVNSQNGDVYVSDVPGGKIYKLKNGKLSPWLVSDKLPYPNGVLVEGDSLIVANYVQKTGEGLMRQEWKPEDFGTIYRVNLEDKALTAIESSTRKGVFDGIINFNGTLISSSNPTGQIISFAEGQSHLLGATTSGIADINTDNQYIYAPYLFNGKLAAFTPVKWDRVTTKAEYLEKGADNYYGDTDGKSIATSEGIIKGIFGGQQLSGRWNWKGEFFCRTSSLGDMDLGSDCIQIDVTEDKMRLVLNEGKGMSVVYDKKPADDEITILSTFTIKPAGIESYTRAMLDNQDVVRGETGTLEMKLFQDSQTPGNFLVFGRNASEESLEQHSEDVEKRGIADTVKNTLLAPPKTLFLVNEDPLPSQDLEVYPVDGDDIQLFFFFEVSADDRDALITQLKKHTKLTRQEAGNIRFDFYTQHDNPNAFVIQEHWANEAAGENHREQTYTKETEVLMKTIVMPETQQVYFVNQIEKETDR